ncbi:MAG: maleylpyruvate isomerase N-terminal domain-containing protein [Actinocatenispora sp.]
MHSRRNQVLGDGAVPEPTGQTRVGTDTQPETTAPPVRAADPVAVTREQGLAAMTTAYRQLSGTVANRSDNDLMRPTRCTGWAVIDVLYHVLLDGQRALIALATPEDRLADTDYVTYWREFAGAKRPGTREHARAVRIAASAFRPRTLIQLWEETSGAAIRAARTTAADSRLITQHHVLTLPDLLATFAVEACLHAMDMAVDLPGSPDPDPEPLALVRRTLDGLLGAGVSRPDWTDEQYALKGTGRLPLTDGERAILAPVVHQFPLFG